MDRGDKNGCIYQVSGINMIPDNIHGPNIEYKNPDTQYCDISIDKIL